MIHQHMSSREPDKLAEQRTHPVFARMLHSAVVAALSLTGILATATGAASAEGLCGERHEILNSIATRHVNPPVATGLAYGEGLIEVLETNDRLTWTIINTMPDGTTCVVGVVESWDERLRKIAPPAS